MDDLNDKGLLERTANEFDGMAERLDELEDWALDNGYAAIQYKMSEARGPLVQAALAARQYANGTLEPRTS